MTELDLHTMAEELINAKNVQDTNKDWKVIGYSGRREVFYDKYIATIYTIKLRKK